MNRKEAIEELKKYVKDSIKFYEQSISTGFGEGSYCHQIFNEIIKAFEHPITLTDLLGWEEGVEYELFNRKFMILADNKLYELFNDKWYKCSFGINKYKGLQQAKKVEPKLKAYHVKDEYSYNELMKELEEQGYMWSFDEKATDVSYGDISKINTVIYCHENKTLRYSSLDYFNGYRKSNYDLIEYHKEPKTKVWKVRDEYSLKCLVQELQDQGFEYKSILTPEDHIEMGKDVLEDGGTPYFYIDEANGINGFNLYYSIDDDDKFEVIDYHKEEPLYYAIDRIGKLDNDNSYYLVRFYDEFSERYYFGTIEKESADKLTKTEWNKLGINDTNADFEKVED